MKKVAEFKEKLVEYLTKTTDSYVKCEKLIKYDVDSKKVDFTFGINMENIWSNYLSAQDNWQKFGNSVLIYGSNEQDIDDNQAVQKLVEASEKWPLKISSARIVDGICEIHLNRNNTFPLVLDLVAREDYCRYDKINGKSISLAIDEVEKSSITHFRLKTLKNALAKLITLHSQYNLIDKKTAYSNLILTTRSNIKNNEDSEKLISILCGVVDSKQNNAEDILKKRQEDMHLMAVHKYGVRVKNHEEFLELKTKLGSASVKLEMIEVKHSHVLRLTPNIRQAFILYNSARLENLLATFNQKDYPPLPSLQEINLELLTDEAEWELLKYMLSLPDVLEKSLGDVLNGQIALHTLAKYLEAFVNKFSIYYSKKKILVENRPHLIPLIHAKIHFLLAVQKCLNLVLNIFDIEPVLFM